MSATATHASGKGSSYRYDMGCRCDECRTAKRQKRKRARDRARAENRPSYQRELAASRAAKQLLRGICESCGRETRYNGGRGNVISRLCLSCSNREKALLVQGTGPTQARTLALLADGPKHFMDISRALGKPKGAIGPHLLRLMEYGLVVRPERGVYALAAQAGAEAPVKPKIGARASDSR